MMTHYRVYPHAQGSIEWHMIRKQYIGASDAPVIMGVSPWSTPYELWKQKVSPICIDKEETEAMRWGKSKEEEARLIFERETGIYVFPMTAFSIEHDWMMSSLDGINMESTVIVEIKCPGREDQERAMEGHVPDKYYAQLQHQIETVRPDQTFYMSLHRDGTYKILEVKRDQSYIDRMLEEEEAFFKLMKSQEPPDLCDRDYTTKEDELWQQTAAMWLDTKYQLRKFEAMEEEYRKSLIQLAGQNSARGAGLRVTKMLRKGNVDYKAIPDLIGVDLDQYRKAPSESWRITQDLYDPHKKEKENASSTAPSIS